VVGLGFGGVITEREDVTCDGWMDGLIAPFKGWERKCYYSKKILAMCDG
jgi:hypothetical protein